VALIPGGVQPGKAVVAKGLAIATSEKRFDLNLCCGLLVDGDHRDNIALHLNPRFVDKQLVLNTLINNQWGKEERFPSPIKAGQAFEIRILTLTDCFKVAINGKHVADFKHRIAVREIQTLFVKGALTLDFIQFQGDTPVTTGGGGGAAGLSAMSAAGYPPSFVPTQSSTAPIIKPPTPFTHPFVGGLRPNQQIFVTATPRNQGFDGFCINFNAGNDIAFHFNPRADKKVIVRNTMIGGSWAEEERTAPNFPFLPGATFDLIFLADYDGFKVAVNGQHFLAYKHRIQMQKVDSIFIDGAIQLQQVHIQ
jgi:hypothetical protein